ncbi:TPA: TonB-dependent siderophore receptor [Morganella morganii]
MKSAAHLRRPRCYSRLVLTFPFIFIPVFHAVAADDTLVVTAAPQDREGSYSGDNVYSTLKTLTPRNETPQSISIVTPQLIRDFNVTSVDDAVKFVSGVTQGNTLGGIEDGFVKRGFGSNTDGSVFIDGVRSNQGLAMDATTERVDVLKGSSSLLYGIMNPGGVINLISKKPQYQWQGRISGRTNSNGGGTGTIDVTGPLGNGVAVRLIAERRHEDYWRNFGEDQHTLLAPSLSWLGDSASFNVAYTENKFDVPYDRGTAFIGGSPIRIPYNERIDDNANHAYGKNKRLTAEYRQEFDGIWETGIKYAWMQRRYDSNEVRATAINPETGIVTRRADANRGFNHQTTYIGWDISGTPELAGMRHDITLGADYEKNETYKAWSFRGKPSKQFNMYHPVYGESPVTTDKTADDAKSNLRATVYSSSLYAKDSIHLNDQWIVVLGGRLQRYTQNGSSGWINHQTTLNDSGSEFVPQAGVVYKLTPELALYSSYSQSFTPSAQVDDDGNVASTEKGQTYELGAKWQTTPTMLTTFALYRIDEKDMSIFMNGLNRNIPKSRSEGAELEINGEFAPGWQIAANYSLNRTQIKEDNLKPQNVGNQLVNAPRNMGSLYLTHTLTVPGLPGELRFGGGGRYVGKRAGDPENSFYLPAYTVTDAFAAWNGTVSGHETQLKLNVNNLLNREYYASSAGNLRVIAGEPRTLFLNASVDF